MADQTDICFLSLARASAQIAERKLTSLQLTQACLDRIKQHDPQYNAFISVFFADALQQARALDAELATGKTRGPLHGIPVAVKDLVDIEGLVTTAGSKLFAHAHPARHDAEVIRRLKDAGAVIVGKTNLHEFAYGGSGYISHFGPVRNPRNPEYVTGGSSSGSAAAVAAGFCFAAIGTDTAGSIRLPASCCGIVGLKPTYGLVSAHGVVPLSWNYDHVGPMTRTVEDAAMVLKAIAGYDWMDLFSRKWPLPDYPNALAVDLSKLRVGVARDYFFLFLGPEVERVINAAVERLRGMTAGIKDVAIPVDEDRTVSGGDAYAYHRSFLLDRADQYHPETLRRIRSAEKVTATDYILKLRELKAVRRVAGNIYREIDVVITPTVPIPPPSFTELEEHPDRLRAIELTMLRNTRPFNTLGLPTISIPCGATKAGLPVGLQISAAPGRDDLVLAVAQQLEQLFSK